MGWSHKASGCVRDYVTAEERLWMLSAHPQLTLEGKRLGREGCRLTSQSQIGAYSVSRGGHTQRLRMCVSE